VTVNWNGKRLKIRGVRYNTVLFLFVLFLILVCFPFYHNRTLGHIPKCSVPGWRLNIRTVDLL
jgi:hypothetical protein